MLLLLTINCLNWICFRSAAASERVVNFRQLGVVGKAQKRCLFNVEIR